MLFEWFWLLTNKQTDAFMTDSSRFYYKKFLLNGFNPCLVGGGGTPSLTSSRAVNNDFYDSKPEREFFECIILNF